MLDRLEDFIAHGHPAAIIAAGAAVGVLVMLLGVGAVVGLRLTFG